MALYDDEAFFGNYAQMARSRGGLEAAGEWPQFSALLPQGISARRFSCVRIHQRSGEVLPF